MILREKFLRLIPITLISWDIIKYYLLTSYDRRTTYSGPFPYLRYNLDRNQIKVFQDFDLDVIGNLKKLYEREN